MSQQLRIFLIAGEVSGDILGAGLMHALKLSHPDIVFSGIGGSRMQKEGLQSIFPMEELSVMGVSEVLPKIFHIWARIRQTVRAIIDFQPHALITIDSPDFCFRIAERIKSKKRDIPCIHYVAPSVWAWRPGRAKKVAKFLDHILALLPFEPPYFEKHGLATTFVGHVVVERMSHRGDGTRFRQKYGVNEDQPVLCVLPGSRSSELDRLLEKFSQTLDIILQHHHDMAVVIPTLPHLRGRIETFFVGKGINPIITDSEDDKFDAFSASMIALAASGTVTLELALTDTPHVIAFKLAPFSAWLAKRLIRTPYVNLVNIVLQRSVVPELLMEQCEPKPMSDALLKLMDDKDARTAQLMDFRQALIKIGLGDPKTPSQKAAETVLRIIHDKSDDKRKKSAV